MSIMTYCGVINCEQTQKKIKREWMPKLLILTGIAIKATHFNNATRKITMVITIKRYSFYFIKEKLAYYIILVPGVLHNVLIFGYTVK